MPTFRDDHILIISPGSSQTLAQLGLPESYTPARFRFSSRMFRSIESGKWTYTKFRPLKEEELELLSSEDLAAIKGNKSAKSGTEEAAASQSAATPAAAGAGAAGTGTTPAASGVKDEDGDIQLSDRPAGNAGEDEDEGGESGEEGEGDEGDEDEDDQEGEQEGDDEADQGDAASEEEEEEISDGIFIVDEDDETDAVWPIKEGRVTNWPCFFALLSHIHEYINPPFHTPLLMTCPPFWSRHDRELVTQFAFERLKVPGFCLLDSAMAVTSAYGVPTSIVVDVGKDKTDLTPISGFMVKEQAATYIPVGGETMTKHLQSILPTWTREEVEALKCSPICEILPSDSEGTYSTLTSGSKDVQEEDGVTNVAAIVASGKTHEYLAKKEKEKQEAQKGSTAQKNLPNAERETNGFWIVEKVKDFVEESDEPPVVQNGQSMEGVVTQATENPVANPEPQATEPVPVPAPAAANTEAVASETLPDADANPKPESTDNAEPKPEASAAEATTEAVAGDATTSPKPPAAESAEPAANPTNTEPAPTAENDTVMREAGDPPQPQTNGDEEAARLAREAKQREKEKRKEEKRRARGEGLAPNEVRRYIEVGRERFQAAECGILSDISDAVYRLISTIDEINVRSEIWNNLIICGNGSRIKGFKEALLETISKRYIISPSSATMFTSEIPSSVSTPLPTGASTPLQQPSIQSNPGVNPLLVAATTANLHLPGGNQLHPGSGHVSHSQTPTSIRMAKFPEYFPEWKDAGHEEAAFLGAQIHAKVVFVVDAAQGQSNKGFLSRIEYNEMGPSGIHVV